MASIMLTKHREFYISTAKAGTTETFVKLAAGFDSAGISHNPSTSQHIWLDKTNQHTEVLGYGKEISLSGVRYVGDDANDLIASKTTSTGADSHVTLVIVEVEAGATSGNAKKYDATVAVTSEGGDGGGEVTLEATLYLNDEPTAGTFDTSTKKFTASV